MSTDFENYKKKYPRIDNPCPQELCCKIGPTGPRGPIGAQGIKTAD